MGQSDYKIRPLAEADLDGHAQYIAKDNLEAGIRLYECAEQTYQALAEMPHLGVIYQFSKAELVGMRFFPIQDFPRYLVFYLPMEGGVDIIRVLHARMDKDEWL